MVDKITSERRRANMRNIKSTDMKPEIAVRKLTHGMGYRYKLHDKRLPGKPDLVFPSRQKVIFVHGCFWHQHSKQRCIDARIPKSNIEYWIPKLEANVKRDQRNIRELKKLGWKVLVVWECEIKKISLIKSRINSFLSS